MSFYAYIQGELKYSDQDSFDEIINVLTDRQYLNQKGLFLNGSGEIVCKNYPESNINKENLTINIPFGMYNKLSRIDLFSPKKELKVEGYIIGASTDGMFLGWFTENGKTEEYKLNE